MEKIGQTLDIFEGKNNMTCRCGRVREEEECKFDDYQIWGASGKMCLPN